MEKADQMLDETKAPAPGQPGLVTDRDWEVYQAIVMFKMDNDGCAPQLRELMDLAHMSSTSVVTHHLVRLASAGLIEYGKKARMIHVRGGRWTPPPAIAGEPEEPDGAPCTSQPAVDGPEHETLEETPCL